MLDREAKSYLQGVGAFFVTLGAVVLAIAAIVFAVKLVMTPAGASFLCLVLFGSIALYNGLKIIESTEPKP